MNFGTQWITKGDWRQIDAFDVTISGFGGDKCGQVFTGVGGGLLDVQLNGSVKAYMTEQSNETVTENLSFIDILGVIFGHEIEHTTDKNATLNANGKKFEAPAYQISDQILKEIKDKKKDN